MIDRKILCLSAVAEVGEGPALAGVGVAPGAGGHLVVAATRGPDGEGLAAVGRPVEAVGSLAASVAIDVGPSAAERAPAVGAVITRTRDHRQRLQLRPYRAGSSRGGWVSHPGATTGDHGQHERRQPDPRSSAA